MTLGAVRSRTANSCSGHSSFDGDLASTEAQQRFRRTYPKEAFSCAPVLSSSNGLVAAARYVLRARYASTTSQLERVRARQTLRHSCDRGEVRKVKLLLRFSS